MYLLDAKRPRLVCRDAQSDASVIFHARNPGQEEGGEPINPRYKEGRRPPMRPGALMAAIKMRRRWRRRRRVGDCE